MFVNRSLISLFGLGALGLIGWLIWSEVTAENVPILHPFPVANSGSEPEDPRFKTWRERIDQHFAGDAACRDCHADQFAAHQRSGHSHTAEWLADSELGIRLQNAVWQDALRKSQFRFELREGKFLVSLLEQPQAPLEVHWLLGSGTHARTPVAMLPEQSGGVELRCTWFTESNQLGLTPEHDQFEPHQPDSLECYGRPQNAQDVRGCLSCHMTFGPLESQPLERKYFQPNISCERCHGPRRQHVEEATLGLGLRTRPLVQFDSAEKYLKICGQCHRDETNVGKDSSPAQLARFQPYGLQRSRCYQQTAGGFSCSRCHDPHDATRRDRVWYDSRCLECHSAPERTPCPKNPRRNCIDCHMPAVEFVPGVRFHDHHIRLHATP